MAGQLGHRHQDEILGEADPDFLESGFSPEHNGEHSKLPDPDFLNHG